MLTSSDFVEGLNFGQANLENYRIAAGPQQAASIGLSTEIQIIGGLVQQPISLQTPMLMFHH